VLGETGPQIVGQRIFTLFGSNWLTNWFVSRAVPQLELLNIASYWLDAIQGRICVSTGPTLMLYRVHTPGTPDGFQRPFASSAVADRPALAAFDGGKDTYWRPLPDQRVGSFVGFDFGGGGRKDVSRVVVEWPKEDLAASRIDIEYADVDGDWRKAGQFEVKPALGSDQKVTSEHELSPDVGPHRLWRVVLSEVPGARDVAVNEVRLLSVQDIAARGPLDTKPKP
jgi:hypothetical protein